VEMNYLDGYPTSRERADGRLEADVGVIVFEQGFPFLEHTSR